jgi:hypothetical protein
MLIGAVPFLGDDIMDKQQLVYWLHRYQDIPEDELQMLPAEQLGDIWATLSAGQEGRLTEAEVTDRLKASGLFDLPTVRAKMEQHVNETLDAEVRAIMDRYGFSLAKEDEPYPPARSN